MSTRKRIESFCHHVKIWSTLGQVHSSQPTRLPSFESLENRVLMSSVGLVEAVPVEEGTTTSHIVVEVDAPTAVVSYSLRGDDVAFNPQPEPPKDLVLKLGLGGDDVAFNPQPEPPKFKQSMNIGTGADEVGFNPQPDPPKTMEIFEVDLGTSASAGFGGPIGSMIGSISK